MNQLSLELSVVGTGAYKAQTSNVPILEIEKRDREENRKQREREQMRERKERERKEYTDSQT